MHYPKVAIFFYIYTQYEQFLCKYVHKIRQNFTSNLKDVTHVHMMIIPNHMPKSYATCVYYLLKLSLMTLEDLCKNIKWNKSSIFYNFVDPMYIPCSVTHSQLLKGPKCGSKWNTAKEGGVEARSLAHNTLRGRGACWSSGMWLGRVDKLHSLTHMGLHTTHTKWLVHSWSTLGRTTGNTNTQDSPRPGLGESHHLPPYSIIYSSPRRLHPNGSFSQDSRMRVPKSRQLGVPRLWSPITLRADLWLSCDLKKSCSSRRELSNDMWHAPCN